MNKQSRTADKGWSCSCGVGKDVTNQSRKPRNRSGPSVQPKQWKGDEDNIKIYLREVGSGMDWIDLAQNRDRWRAVVNAVMNPRVP